MIPDFTGAGSLLADFAAFARRRSAAALLLISAGAALEGIGIVMLIPLITIVLGSAGGNTATSLSEPLFRALGLESASGRVAAALAGFLAVVALRFVVLLLRDDLLERMQQDFVADLRSRAFRRLAALPWAEAAGLRQSRVAHALTYEVDRVTGGIDAAIQCGVACVVLAVQFAIALALAPAVTLVAAALMLILFRALRPLRDRAAGRGAELSHGGQDLFAGIGGFLRGLKPAKAHGLESQYIAEVEAAAGRIGAANRDFARDHALARLLLQSAAGAVGAVAVLLGLFVFGTGPERLVVALVILARLSTPVQVLQNTVQILHHAAAGYRAAREIAGPPAREAPHADAAPAEPLDAAPEIRLSGVTVLAAEPDAPPLLAGIDAVLPAGSVTALVGESGSGKSTFCDVAVGLVRPDAGEVRIDGLPLDDVRLRRLAASLAYVGQEPFLFEGSLRANLCWGCPPVGDARIWEVLDRVGAAGLARGLDGGLDGWIRAEGTRFSGGERQRLRLARALLRRPRLLVLDESTNALDQAAELAVLRAVLAGRGGATVLMVSHRPAIRAIAGREILLQSGRLASRRPRPAP